MTGCCGYLGSWITLALLRAGHRVRGTTQDTAYAQALFDEVFHREGNGALRQQLEIVPADLLDAGSWSGLADGCSVVVHTACPVVTDVGAPRHAMIDPALVGTKNVLHEAARAGGITRVVHMSSIVTLLDHHRPVPGGTDELVGPRDWNETTSPQTDPYAFAKVHGEHMARARVAENIPDATFAAVLPGPVIGPPLAGSRVAGSIEKTLAPLLTGQLRLGSIALSLGLVDVRDVAAVFARIVDLPHHQLAALGASSRFVCTAQPATSLQELADAIREGFPEYAPLLPRRRLLLPRALLLLGMRFSLTPEAYSYTRAMLGRRVSYDTTLSEDILSMRWRPAAQSVNDTVRWLRAHGHYPPPS